MRRWLNFNDIVVRKVMFVVVKFESNLIRWLMILLFQKKVRPSINFIVNST